MFHLQVGSHEDEPAVIARFMAAHGTQRIGLVYDRSPIGLRYRRFLEAEAVTNGLEISAALPVAPLAEEAPAGLSRMLQSGIDSVVYLGLGVAASAVAAAVAALGWRGPCVMNTAGIRGYAPAFAEIVDGWMYVDMHSDGNATLAALRQRPGTPISTPLAAAKGYDLGRLVAEGIARAPELTRDGIRDGLEQVKCLPAAQGHHGTVLSFGHHDRGALHGSYLVMRQWVHGKTLEL